MNTRPPRRELVWSLVSVARHLRTYADQVARAHDTTRAQWGLLARLRRREGLSQVELSDELELTPIAVARLVDKVEAQGLIERRPDPQDRRINRLHLTPEGRVVVDSLDPLRARIAAEVTQGIGDDEVLTALSVLERIAGNSRRLAGAAEPQADPVRADLRAATS